MRITLHKNIKNISEIEQIQLLDSLTYSDKYLLSVEDYMERVKINSSILYAAKNTQNIIIGYISIVPLTYDSYIRIKNGETDKEVIDKDAIIKEGTDAEYFYFDSIIIDPAYRRYKLGKKLTSYALYNLQKENPNLKKIVAHTVSKGGRNLLAKYGLEFKKNLDNNTAVVEKVINGKHYRKKKIYRDKDKREVYKKTNCYREIN